MNTSTLPSPDRTPIDLGYTANPPTSAASMSGIGLVADAQRLRRLLPEATVEQTLTPAELADLAAELRYEYTRAQRTSVPGELSDESDALLEALQRIDAGEYGFCFGCGRPIPLGRLQVMPATRTCVGCVR